MIFWCARCRKKIFHFALIVTDTNTRDNILFSTLSFPEDGFPLSQVSPFTSCKLQPCQWHEGEHFRASFQSLFSPSPETNVDLCRRNFTSTLYIASLIIIGTFILTAIAFNLSNLNKLIILILGMTSCHIVSAPECFLSTVMFDNLQGIMLLNNLISSADRTFLAWFVLPFSSDLWSQSGLTLRDTPPLSCVRPPPSLSRQERERGEAAPNTNCR